MQSGRKMKVAWKNFELIGRVFVCKSRKHCQIEFSLLFPKATFLFFSSAGLLTFPISNTFPRSLEFNRSGYIVGNTMHGIRAHASGLQLRV